MSWVACWVAPSPACPAPSRMKTPMDKIRTRRSLDAIIATTNSIQRRTHAREKSAAAPAKAMGARTAATSSMSLRASMAAQTITTAASVTSESSSTTAGFDWEASRATVSLAPRPATLVSMVAWTTPALSASTAARRTRVAARANAVPRVAVTRPETARWRPPGSCRSTARMSWMANRPTQSTAAIAPVIAISRRRFGEVRSRVVASSICSHNHVVALTDASPK